MSEKKNFWCRLFGHKITDIDILIAKIEASKINIKNHGIPKLICRRCYIDIIQERLNHV